MLKESSQQVPASVPQFAQHQTPPSCRSTLERPIRKRNRTERPSQEAFFTHAQRGQDSTDARRPAKADQVRLRRTLEVHAHVRTEISATRTRTTSIGVAHELGHAARLKHEREYLHANRGETTRIGALEIRLRIWRPSAAIDSPQPPSSENRRVKQRAHDRTSASGGLSPYAADSHGAAASEQQFVSVSYKLGVHLPRREASKTSAEHKMLKSARR